MATGLGRSGRGQALLKALGQPVRRPGQPANEEGQPLAEQQSISGHSPPPALSANQPTQAVEPLVNMPSSPKTMTASPVGRGLRTSLLAQHSAETVTPPQVVSMPGRGLRKILGTPQPQCSPGTVQSSPAKPMAALEQSPRARVSASPVTPTNVSTGVASLSLQQTPPQERKGTTGQRIPLNANYLLVQGKSEGVFQYTVAYDPIVESKGMRYSMIAALDSVIGKTRAFDGTTLYLPKKITDTTITFSAVRPTDEANITISVTLVAVVQYGDCVQLFNVIFKRVLRALELKPVGRNYYDPTCPIAIPQHKMELWPGYISSIQEYDSGLLLLFDVSHRLMRTDSALDFLYELHSKTGDVKFQEQAYKHIVGVVVLTRYNNRTYRVDDIAWDKNPASTFMDHNGKAITFIDYYKRAYGKEIVDKDQPLLIHRPKRKLIGLDDEAPDQVICLIPELCCMTGLTEMARADFRVMKDIAQHTRIQPNQREAIFKRFVEKVNTSPKAKEELSSWGFQLDPRMIQVDGRLLQREKILFGGNKSVLANEEADWSREAVKETVITPVPLRTWILVVTKRDKSKAVDFLNMMKRVGPPMGIEVADPSLVEVPNDRTDTYLSAVRRMITSQLQLVVVVFPTSRDDRYSAFKKLCCIENPVPSQVINARTISVAQKLRSVTQKVALQINCKLGGELWALEIPVKNMMVIGMDVYHDSSTGQKRSILGFVASTNRHLTRWYSRVSIQGKRQEIADGLKLCVNAALTKYHEVNHTLPDRIMVFRDGVGDGQMNTVAQFEIPQIEEAFSLFGENYKPRMAVVIVQKRISTRIFLRGSPKGLGNPPPGTIVDHTFTRKGWYDYFLVSQHVHQGTVTPTHYVVVHDSSGFKVDHIQRLTYKLTHMYYNWPGTIRVPAPCQYAHKLAFLVGQSLHRDPDLGLSDRLFFL